MEEERNPSPRRSEAETFSTPIPSNGSQSSQCPSIFQHPSTNTQNISSLQVSDCMMNSGGFKEKEKNTECVVGNSVATTKYPSQQSELPILGMTFKSREELLCATKSVYSKQGYALSIKNSKKEKYIVIGCDRGGTYRDKRGVPLEERKKKSGTRLINCPFEVRGKKNPYGFWVLQMRNSSHNHEASFDTAGNPSCRRLSREQILEIEKLTRAGVQPRQILSALRHKNVDTQAVSKTIYNVKTKIKKEAAAHRTAIQALFDELGQEIDPISLQKEVEARMEKRQRELDEADSRQKELEAQSEARARLQTVCPSGSALGGSTIGLASGRNHDEEPQTEGASGQGTTSGPNVIGSLDKERENSIKFHYDENVPTLRDTHDNQEILRGLTKHLEGAIYAASMLESSTSSGGPESAKEKNKNLIEELRVLRSVKVKWEASSKKFEYLYQTSSKRLEEEKARSLGLQTTVDRLESELASVKDQLEKAEEASAANSEAWTCEKDAYEEKIQALRVQVIEAVMGTRDQGEEDAMSLCRRLSGHGNVAQESAVTLPLDFVKNLPDDLSFPGQADPKKARFSGWNDGLGGVGR